MCEIVSGFMNKQTLEVVIADPRSHSKTQELMGWSSREVDENWGEWEWLLNIRNSGLLEVGGGM